MTDVSQGPGWWMASDGKWYPPELHPAVRAAAVTQAASATLAGGAPPAVTPPVAVPQNGDPAAAAPIAQPVAPGYAQPVAPGYAQPTVVPTGYSQPGYAQPGYAPPAFGPPGTAPLTYAPLGYAPGAGAPNGVGVPGAEGALGVVATKPRRRRARATRPAAPPGVAPRPGGPSGGFDDNPYALPKHLPVGPAPTKKKGHLALPLVLLLIAGLVAAAGTAGYILTHPSPHRSPDAVALDFYQKLAADPVDGPGALADVEPSQQAEAAAMVSLREVQSVSTELQNENLSVLNPSKATSTAKLVVVQGCNDSLSCGPVGVSVPTVEVAGKWYVDFASWDALAQKMVADN